MQRWLVSDAPVRQYLRLQWLALLATVLAMPGARAGDEKGQYAVRGAALINCAMFTQARGGNSETYRVVASWVDGYITAINQNVPRTYDVMSFESTELLMAVLDQHCGKHPRDPVFGVISQLVAKLEVDRITAKSDKVSVSVGNRQVLHYADLIKRVQQSLGASGFYKGAASGQYSTQTADAMKRYQKSVKLEPTGFPDQTTLWRLLRKEE